MKRAAQLARWLAFVVTALAAADLIAHVVANRLAAGQGVVARNVAGAAGARSRPRQNDRYYVEPVLKRNLFRITSPDAPAPTKSKEEDKGPLQTSALSQRFELVGTVVSADAAESVAVVQERAGAQEAKLYAIGDRLGDEADIVSVDPQRIVLDVGGRREQIAIELEGDQPGANPPFRAAGAAVAPTAPATELADGIRRNPDGSFTLDSRMVENQLTNLSELLTQARAVPNFEDGKTNGFRLFSIKRGSIFDQIGLRNGDVIRKVNSNELNDPAVALNVFQELRSSRDFQVTVLRNNHEETLSYQVR
ncbi:MAG: type II secretion system protein GspC [bacterium]